MLDRRRRDGYSLAALNAVRESWPERWRERWPYALVLLVTAAVYAATAGLPYLSETWSHTVAARTIDGVADLFDPARVPLRPFQHVWFWGMETLWPVPPALARLPGFAAHLLCCLLVAVLCRRLGGTPRTAALAALGFALFPNVKSVVYVAAIGWPFRVLATLLGVCALLAHAGRPRARTGLAIVGSFLFGLACNQGAVVFPALGALLLLGARGREAVGLWRDPWLLACAALAVGYGFYVAFLHQRDVHQVVAGGAVLANGARAALCLLPEALRVPVIEALRGGGTAMLGGLAAMVALGAALAAWLWRGPAVVRALLLCLPLEWLPALAVTGFAQRYAYLGAALAVVAITLSWQQAQGRLRVAFAVLGIGLAGAWASDTVVDVRDLRGAGRAIDSVLAAAGEARARAGPGTTIILLDPPQVIGSENDVLVFDYGLQEALMLAGVAGPWQVMATVGPWWRPSVVREPRERILARLREAGGPFVAFDPWTGAVIEAR